MERQPISKQQWPDWLKTYPENVVEMWLDSLRSGKLEIGYQYTNEAKREMVKDFTKLMKAEGLKTEAETTEKGDIILKTRSKNF